MGKMKARARYNHAPTQQFVSNPAHFGTTENESMSLLSSTMPVPVQAGGGGRQNNNNNIVHVAADPQNTAAATWGVEDVWCGYRTVAAGQRVMVRYNRTGEVGFVTGPARPFLFRATITHVRKYAATASSYLVVTWLSGNVEHVVGPAELWFDPLEMRSVRVEPVIRLNANEAMVVYDKPDGADEFVRAVRKGPACFVPDVESWIQSFTWGSDESGGAAFTRLKLVPEECSVEIENARSLDDALLKLHFSLTFRLVDVELMCDVANDPVTDFSNALAADVLTFLSKQTFEAFKAFTPQLSDVGSYPTVLARARESGFEILSIAFRGFAGTSAIQGLQERAFERRKQLELEAEAERNRQHAELERSREQFELETASAQHKARIKSEAARAELDAKNAALEAERTHARELLQIRLGYLEHLSSKLNVDLTAVMVAQAKQDPDTHIKLDLSGAEASGAAAVHVHTAGAPPPSSAPSRMRARQ